MPILSPVTDNLLFLNQRKREIIFPRKNIPDTRIDYGTVAYEVGTLPTELPRVVVYITENDEQIKASNESKAKVEIHREILFKISAMEPDEASLIEDYFNKAVKR